MNCAEKGWGVLKLVENENFCANLYVYNSRAHAPRRGGGGRWGSLDIDTFACVVSRFAYNGLHQVGMIRLC